MNESKVGTILLFDVDGTLTLPRQNLWHIGLCIFHVFLGRCDYAGHFSLVAICRSSENGSSNERFHDGILSRFDYLFSENGLVSISKETTFPAQSIKHRLGETRLKKLINFTLREFAEIDLPGMLNLSPIGRSCTQEERLQFAAYDKEHGVLQKFVKKLEDFTKGWDLNICIGGQISVDVFPYGWDKTYCLQFLNNFHTVHFFGDRTTPEGNDYHLFTDPRTTGYTVKDPEDTMKQVLSSHAKNEG
ncbi:eukaryotic phosphomannomutase [Onchocerca flexuosa]|uniref:Phosphomannomutase n=1 Tax=Onchocerca flexuosa TaxID=387005 RepID=A0A238C2K2_9BILA|nr:eukaryotic phosphomannomutase [Onchocerca flexuosa]